ncbi:MAG: IS30 family transposase [bacterium]|nr:IS30 family transposase [bacterium]MCY4134791.1 IS30 family transposase [bacterium]
MADHAQITADTGVPIYFCRPPCPWQRGTNENTNGLLRQYLPKGTDLSPISQHELDQIAAEPNGRPRRVLQWMTPLEAINQTSAMTT